MTAWELHRRPSSGNAVAPMDGQGELVDEAEYRRLVRYMADAGTNVFIGGPHATEFVNMGRAERQRLWEVAVDELHDHPVYAIPLGPGSTTDMIEAFRLAGSIGFAGAQLYPGAQDGHGNDGLFVAEAERYFRDVLEAVDLPVFLCGYHGGEIIDGPRRLFPFDRIVALAEEYPHIVGVTVGDMVHDDSSDADLAALVGALSPRVPVRLAGGVDWFARMELGIFGFHSIQQSIAPRLCVLMMDAFHGGDLVAARELADRIRALNVIVHDPRYAYPRSLKPVLNHLGFETGAIRRPYLPLAEPVRAELCARVDELELWRHESVPARPADAG